MTMEQLNWFDRLMVSVTFAEAGEAETALRYLEPDRPADRVQKEQRIRRQPSTDNRPQMRL